MRAKFGTGTRGLLAIGVAVAVFVSGCSGDPEISPSPTGIQTPTPDQTIVPDPGPTGGPDAPDTPDTESPITSDGDKPETPAPKPTKRVAPTADPFPFSIPAGFSTVLDDKMGPVELFDVRDGWVTYAQADDRAGKAYLVTVTSYQDNDFRTTVPGTKSRKVAYDGEFEYIDWAFTIPGFGTVFGITNYPDKTHEIRYWDVEENSKPQPILKMSENDAYDRNAVISNNRLYFPRVYRGKACLSSMELDGKSNPASTLKNVVCSKGTVEGLKSGADGSVSFLTFDKPEIGECARLNWIPAGSKVPEVVNIPSTCLVRGQVDATYVVWATLPPGDADDGKVDWNYKPLTVMTIVDRKIIDLGMGQADSVMPCEGGVAWHVPGDGATDGVDFIKFWHPETGVKDIYSSKMQLESDGTLWPVFRFTRISCFEGKLSFSRSGSNFKTGQTVYEELLRTGK